MNNIGLALHCHLTMNEHSSYFVLTCNFELHRLASIHRLLINTATEHLNQPLFRHKLTTVLTHCCLDLLATDTELYRSRNLTHSKVNLHNHTFEMTSLASSESKKQLQNRLFVLSLLQQYCTIIYHRYAAEKVVI